MNIKEIDKPEIKKVVVVYAGRFQPFHKGHYATYQKLVSKFGANNVYIGTSNDTSGPKSPFNFNEKKTIMNKMFGIPSNKIVQVKNPYAPKEVLSGMDGKTTAYVAAVGEKDATRLAGKYFKPYKGKAGYGYDEIGYVYPVPAEDNAISGTDVRNWLSKGDDKDKQKGFTKAYPKFDKDIFNMITGKLNEELYRGYPSKEQVKDIEKKNKEFRNSTESTSDEEYLYDPISEILGIAAAENIFEEFVKTYFKEESEAEKMGLKHLGGGYYGKEGQPATHKSDNGKIRTLTPKEIDAVKKKAMSKGPSDAPVNEPKPSQPGQPVNKGATAQGKVDKAKEEPTDKKAGTEKPDEQAPPPEQKLSGAELKSSAETSNTEKAEADVKAKLDSAKKDLSDDDTKTLENVNNPESTERKGMMGNIKSGLQKFGKGLVHWAEHKKEMVGGTMDAVKALASGQKIGSTKNKETGKWEYSDETREKQIKHVKHFALDVGLILGSMALGGAGVAVAKSVMAGKAAAAGSAAVHGATGAFTHGVGGFAAHLGKDIAKHATLEAMGLGGISAAGTGAGLSTATMGLLEGIGSVDDTQKFSMNLMKTVVDKMQTYKMSDSQLLASIESYNKQKPQQAANKLVGDLNENISETKQQSIQNFIEYATKRLKLQETPKITLVGGREFAEVKTSLGGYNPDDKTIYVATEGRLTADILRTLAHEMVHRKQDEMHLVKNAETDGADGSPIENQAHAIAGILMREYGRINKQIYNEDVNVNVDKGDTILMGKFKNKKTTVKDIGKDNHGMPTINGKQATTFRIPRGEEKSNSQSVFNEVGPNDWHFKAIMKMWDTAGSFGRKKIGVIVCNNPKADRNDVARTLRNYGYKEVTHVTDKLGLDEKKNLNESILTEGGAYGHMSHPFDDMDLTFGDLKKIIKGALTGNLELTREKTDGQALAISWKNGRLVAARNKSHLQNAGAGAMGIEDVASKFAGRGGLTDAYNYAMKDLSAAISGLSEAQRKKIFNEGQCFMNLEVIWPTSVNVIPYGQALLVFHNTTCYDEKGSAVSANQGAATMLAGMIKQVNADIQSKYTIQGPPVTELPKNEELSSKQTKYLTQLQKLQFEFQLSDKDGVSEYHQAWWEDFVNKSKFKLQKLEKEALVRRWAFGDKSFRLNTIADKDAQSWAMENDKVNVTKQQKDNVRQFEEIFLGVGADVLSFMGSVLTVNPDAAVRNMKDRLKSTAEKVRGSGDVSKIAKLKMELSRLASIGGKDKIVPNEGIVFVYKGNTYKLTGTFAPLNQILGIFYE